MRINHNIAALNTFRQMAVNQANASNNIAKLSSGLRINKAGDDAAGLAISEKMRAQIRGLDQAQRNAQDGISMVQTAESSLSETQSILQRMRELATQAANDTNTDTDRAEIQKEVNQLSSEINRIGNTTEFNTQKLLKGTNQAVVATDVAKSTITDGVAGVAVGSLSAVTVNAASVKAIDSEAYVQASTASATGTIDSTTVNTSSVKGQQATVGLSNGMNFRTTDYDDTQNGNTVEIVTAAGASNTYTYNAGTGVHTISIGEDNLAAITNRGELYNAITNATGFSTATIELDEVPGSLTGVDILETGITSSNSLAGGITEQLGDFEFNITDGFEEAGDTVTIAGRTFTSVLTGANASKGQFNVIAALQGGTNIDTLRDANGAVTAATQQGGADMAASIDFATDIASLTTNKLVLNGQDITLTAVKALGDGINGTTAQAAIVAALQSDIDAVFDGTAFGGQTFTVGNTVNKIDIDSDYSGISGKVDLTGSDTTAAALFGLQAGDLVSVLGQGINAGTSVDFSVDGTAYTINNAALVAGLTAGQTKASIQTLVGAALNGATALSTVADVSFNGNKLVVTSKTTGITSEVEFTITDGADDTVGLEAAFGLADDDITSQAHSLAAAIEADSVLGARFDAATVTVNASDATVQLVESTGQATGSNLGNAVVAGGGQNDKLIISDATGRNLKTVTIAQNTTDALSVTGTGGELTINLAKTSAYKNTAAEIQKAVQALGTVSGVDFSKYEFTTEGDWDTSTTGLSIARATGTLVGGTLEVKGDYTLDITKAFEVDDIVNIKGQVFKAVASGAGIGEFNVAGGDLNAQATSLRDAINLNDTLKALYTAAGTGSEVQLVEKSASGVDLQSTDVKVSATGTQGEYSASVDEVLANGAKLVIDGEEIVVSNKNAHVGYDNGTAIKETTSIADQTTELVDAINKNSTLSLKYTASVGSDGNLMLTQKEGYETATAPQVATMNSALEDFKATFQIGANAGQSMDIEFNDMRSAALGVTGDGSETSVAAKDGQVAYYLETTDVTNGTDSNNVEYALDVSSTTKAAAAISVINDAIETVSAERSRMGAYTNRLEHTINNLGTSSENMTAAESRIRDVDMAKEYGEYTKNNVLAQAAQAMLAQANQQPQQVLQLLR